MPLYYKSGSSWIEFSSNPYPIGALAFNDKDVSPASLVGGSWQKAMTGTVSGIKIESDSVGSVYLSFNSNSAITGSITMKSNGRYPKNGEVLASGLPVVYSKTLCGNVSGNVISGGMTFHVADKIYVNSDGTLTYEAVDAADDATYQYTASGNINYTTIQKVYELGGAYIYKRIA